MRANSEECTGRGDLPCVFHDDIENIFDRRIAVVVGICPGDCYWGIGCPVRGGSVNGIVDCDIPGGYIVFATSGNRDVVSLGGLQNESHVFIKETVHTLAPRHREV